MSAENLPEKEFNNSPKAFESIVFGGLTVGVLDGLAACVSAWFSGISPVIVFRYISAALLGRASYEYGFLTVLLGVLLHFSIAFSAAVVYFLLSRKISFLIDQAVISGIIYGIAVHLTMSFLIVPLTLAPPLPFTVSGFIRQILIHIFCVGLPIALITRRSARKSQ